MLLMPLLVGKKSLFIAIVVRYSEQTNPREAVIAVSGHEGEIFGKLEER